MGKTAPKTEEQKKPALRKQERTVVKKKTAAVKASTASDVKDAQRMLLSVKFMSYMMLLTFRMLPRFYPNRHKDLRIMKKMKGLQQQIVKLGKPKK